MREAAVGSVLCVKEVLFLFCPRKRETRRPEANFRADEVGREYLAQAPNYGQGHSPSEATGLSQGHGLVSGSAGARSGPPQAGPPGGSLHVSVYLPPPPTGTQPGSPGNPTPASRRPGPRPTPGSRREAERGLGLTPQPHGPGQSPASEARPSLPLPFPAPPQPRTCGASCTGRAPPPAAIGCFRAFSPSPAAGPCRGST